MKWDINPNCIIAVTKGGAFAFGGSRIMIIKAGHDGDHSYPSARLSRRLPCMHIKDTLASDLASFMLGGIFLMGGEPAIPSVKRSAADCLQRRGSLTFCSSEPLNLENYIGP